MKKIILIFISLLTVNSGLFAQSKLGHVNAQAILMDMPAYKKAAAEIEEYYKSMQTQLESMKNEFRANYQDAMNNQDKYTEIELQDKEAELQNLQNRIQAYETSINQALEQEQKKKVVPIVEQVRQAISDVAEEKDYTYIFNLSEEDGSTLIIMYAKDSEDVTSLVRKKLGL